MRDPTCPKPDLLRKIEAGSKTVKDLATGLSERILIFEDWLNDLPGKVAAKVFAADPDKDSSPMYFFGLSFSRSGKRWILSWVIGYEGDDEPPTYAPLSEAPLDIKIYAIDLFPALLEKMVEAQATLGTELTKAKGRFDKFATELGILWKEGK